MVKKPEPAPANVAESDAFHSLLRMLNEGALASIIQRANEEYLYWDKVKYLELPEEVSPKEMWLVLKAARLLNRRSTPIIDLHGHEFWYSLADSIQRRLMVIDQQAGRTIGSTISSIPPDTKQRYLLSNLMEEAWASSQLEGAATTRRVAKDMLRSGRQPVSRGELMIANNYRTIRTITSLLDEPLTPALLLTLQASLTEGTVKDPGDVGRFRRTDEDIVVGDGFGRIVHVPPPAVRIPEELERLCDYANSEGSGFVHPIIKACLLHFWLAYVHPFCDGNGRTARALFYLHALKSGFWLIEYVAISRVILKQRSRYERAFLYSESDDADCTYFLAFHLRAIEQALNELWDYMERKSREDELLRARLHSEGGLNYRQRAVLTRALKDGTAQFTIESHKASHDVSYGTSRNDLLDLVNRGYLTQERRGRRTYVFYPAPDIRERIQH